MTANAQVTWDNFDDDRKCHYTYRDGDFSVVANPAPGSAVNSSAMCGKYVRNATAQYDVMRCAVPGFLDDLTPYLTGAKTLSVKVYSPGPGKAVQLSLEDTNATTATNYPTGRLAVLTGTTHTTNTWEVINLTFANRPDAAASPSGMNVMLLAFALNSNDGSTYYFDDLQGPSFSTNTVTVGEHMIYAFEGADRGIFGFRDGTEFTQPIDNPLVNTINASPHAAKYVRNPAVQYDVLVAQLADYAIAVDAYAAARKKFSMKVYTDAPVGTSIDLVLQNSIRASAAYPDGRHSVYHATTTVTGTWETLTFEKTLSPDPNQDPATIDQIVLEFNPNSTTGNTYYFDELAGFEVTTRVVDTNRDFIWEDFKNNRHIQYLNMDGELSKVSNPLAASDSVGQYIRSTVQYDVIIMRPPMGSFTALDQYKLNTRKFSAKVWSPVAGTKIGITLQDSMLVVGGNYPTGRHSEYNTTTTVANAWEWVTFNYTNTPDRNVLDDNVNTVAVLVNSGTTAPVTILIDSLYGPTFITGVKDRKNTIQFSAFPVPATDVLNVAFDQTAPGQANIQISDLSGRIVAVANNNGIGQQTKAVNTAALSEGLYFCKLTTPNGTATRKFQVKR
ncbi:MAG: T9SS type A sorting domain-containing protein [Bacteroidota bacterium]